MAIDLKITMEPRMKSVRKMLASADDSEDAQIRVNHDGLAYVERGVLGAERIEGVLFRSETFCAGNGYVGPGAAEDPRWVQEVYEDLQKLQKAYEELKTNWPKPTCSLSYGAEEPYALWPPMVDGYEGPYANWTKLAEGYGGQKLYVEFFPEENGLVDVSKRKVHTF